MARGVAPPIRPRMLASSTASVMAPLPVERPGIDAVAIEQAVRLLEGAKRPLILAGGGALDASADILALAERLGAPVGTYRRGRGVWHGVLLGWMLFMFRSNAVQRAAQGKKARTFVAG